MNSEKITILSVKASLPRTWWDKLLRRTRHHEFEFNIGDGKIVIDGKYMNMKTLITASYRYEGNLEIAKPFLKNRTFKEDSGKEVK